MSRGVSTALGYVLNLGVAAILVTTLMLSAGTLVDDQRRAAVETELEVVGERVAADLSATDRLARASDGGSVRYVVDVPERVAGTTYDVRVNESGNDHVVLVSERPSVRVSVPYDSETHVPAATYSDGRFAFVYDADADALEVERV
ncbi:DUF7266 family protein [Halobacterium wangiae]|uniref:DUF7266 family protein n=1 Tax=Halobacterium wangiae TaxID=2902623 RepID=UPI001E5FE7AA|nr:hypothetical protein [Halobacterium wangiae]